MKGIMCIALLALLAFASAEFEPMVSEIVPEPELTQHLAKVKVPPCVEKGEGSAVYEDCSAQTKALEHNIKVAQYIKQQNRRAKKVKELKNKQKIAEIAKLGFHCGSSNKRHFPKGWKWNKSCGKKHQTIKSTAKDCVGNPACHGFNLDTTDFNIPCFFKSAGASPMNRGHTNKKYIQCKKNPLLLKAAKRGFVCGSSNNKHTPGKSWVWNGSCGHGGNNWKGVNEDGMAAAKDCGGKKACHGFNIDTQAGPKKDRMIPCYFKSAGASPMNVGNLQGKYIQCKKRL